MRPAPAEQAAAEAVFGDRYPLAERYVDILATKGTGWGLLGPREVDRLWSRHVLNSAALTSLVPEGSHIADVGSGAGLPGIPVALARPDLRVRLIEPLLRRVTFLTETVAELGLDDRVDVLRSRAEDDDQRYDIVTCRAVASLSKLIGWCAPLFLPDGQLLALKGSSASDEVAAAGTLLERAALTAEVLTVRAHPSCDPTQVVAVRAAR